jgi:peroxiredoxin
MCVGVRICRGVGALVASLLLAACAHAPEPPPPSSPSPLLGGEMPAFRRPTLQGATFDSAAVAASGRPMVVDFFAAYCRPCQRTLPALEALHAARPDIGIVGISLDDVPESAAHVIDRHHLTFPVVHDGGHVLAGRFRVVDLPATFVADARGRIVWVADPQLAGSEDALARAVAALDGHQ